MTGKTPHPNPGSAEAQKAGCTCAVVDNYYGAGFMYRVDGGITTSFWITEGCPLHHQKKEEQ